MVILITVLAIFLIIGIIRYFIKKPVGFSNSFNTILCLDILEGVFEIIIELFIDIN